MFRRKKKPAGDLIVPRHVAIIMDGNGRWAVKRGLHRKFGHAAGAQTFKNIMDYCIEIGIECLTIYTLSTENFKRRPEDEIASILKLLDEYLDDCIKKLTAYNVRIKFIGDRSQFSGTLTDKMALIEKDTYNKKLRLHIALNYGGRAEIINAVNNFIDENKGSHITEELLEAELYTCGAPPPDLIIRTAGDIRLSNFLLWQSAYSEFYFTDTLWPDFNKESLDRAIADYSGRKRRYGGL